MSENELMAVADAADMIVRGYAFTRNGDTISILNLNRPMCAMVINQQGKMLETSMTPVEQAIVFKIWELNSEFMEAENA